jgi:hypothetical protein
MVMKKNMLVDQIILHPFELRVPNTSCTWMKISHQHDSAQDKLRTQVSFLFLRTIWLVMVGSKGAMWFSLVKQDQLHIP